ncbi:MAG: radical SAM protein [Spirochaetes bacterium]|nr:radical SAM protein [Spirochaetota bacterium]
MKKKDRNICLAYADGAGNVWDLPGVEPAFRTGRRFLPVDGISLIPLPYGSYLFSLPGRYPACYNRRMKDFRHVEVSPHGEEITAASAFLASAYLRTYLPAFVRRDDAPVLPMWAYAGLALRDGRFMVPAIRIDEDTRSDPAIHENEKELRDAVNRVAGEMPGNRLVRQLVRCSTEYRCLCARNFFLGRFEAPVPTTPACNASCIGCLSGQEDGSPFPPSQPRLEFAPTEDEIAGVILRHIESVDGAVASFGQGCEGEPLLRARDLAGAIRMVREKTDRGTINCNTNGSLPGAVRELARAGLDSIRISLSSPTAKYYERYHRPSGYTFDDVLRSLDVALEAGLFVSINLFFLPGFTDSEKEAASLEAFLARFPVAMLQTRNHNIDPDYYLEEIGFEESDPLGIEELLARVRERHGTMRIGYYNPPLR